MGRRNQIRLLGRAWTGALLLFVLVLRGLAVPGYMAAAGIGGAPALVPCPSASPVAHHGAKHPLRHSESPCPFAALAAPALPPAPAPAVAEPAARTLPILLPAGTEGRRPPPASPPPPATGPPLSA